MRIKIATLFATVLLLLTSASSYSQERLGLTNAWNERLLLTGDSVMHTIWKPILFYDTASQKASGTWLQRKAFQEHLLAVEQPGLNIYGDFISDTYIGRSKRNLKLANGKESAKTPTMNSRGVRIFGNAGSKFYFETEFYENQGKFPGYVDSFIRVNKVIPGQNNYKNIGDGAGFDYNYSSARMIYVPSSHFLFDLGYGKNFIGDGYRSLLLSDWSYNYPYLRIATTWGRIQYSAMWSQYISDINFSQNNKLGYYRKWSQTYCLDWKATDKLSISIFESVMWPDQDSLRNKDMSGWLLSPVMFAHGKNAPSGTPNNAIAGLNLKYKVLPKTNVYGQLIVDQLGKTSSWKSRYGFQVGVKSADVFNVPNLDITAEYNKVRPYTYASNSLNTNYAHLNTPLADPLGANFKEAIGVATYQYKKWWFRGELIIAKYGNDSTSSQNYGHNIFKPIDSRSRDEDVKTGQGLKSDLFFADLKVAYIINPKSNLRIETGFTFRNDKNSLRKFEDRYFYIGLRSSFRNLFYDF